MTSKTFTAQDILQRAKDYGMQIILDGDALVVEADVGTVPEQTLQKAIAVIKEYKSELLSHLREEAQHLHPDTMLPEYQGEDLVQQSPDRCADCGASIGLNDRKFFFVATSEEMVVCYCLLCRDETGQPLPTVAAAMPDDQPMTREQFTAIAGQLDTVVEVYHVSEREQVIARIVQEYRERGHKGDKTVEQVGRESWTKLRESQERFDPSMPVDWWYHGFYKDEQNKWRSETRETRPLRAQLEALYKRLPFDEYVHHFSRMMKRPEENSLRV